MPRVRRRVPGRRVSLRESSAASAADLKVQLTGVRNASGDLRAALFDRADAFRKEDKASALVKLPAAPGVAVAVFAGLAPGRYAERVMIILH